MGDQPLRQESVNSENTAFSSVELTAEIARKLNRLPDSFPLQLAKERLLSNSSRNQLLFLLLNKAIIDGDRVVFLLGTEAVIPRIFSPLLSPLKRHTKVSFDSSYHLKFSGPKCQELLKRHSALTRKMRIQIDLLAAQVRQKWQEKGEKGYNAYSVGPHK